MKQKRVPGIAGKRKLLRDRDLHVGEPGKWVWGTSASHMEQEGWLMGPEDKVTRHGATTSAGGGTNQGLPKLQSQRSKNVSMLRPHTQLLRPHDATTVPMSQLSKYVFIFF